MISRVGAGGGIALLHAHRKALRFAFMLFITLFTGILKLVMNVVMIFNFKIYNLNGYNIDSKFKNSNPTPTT